MRWGVRDDATDTHMTTELCLREIKACQEISVGPNFVVSVTILLYNLRAVSFFAKHSHEILILTFFHQTLLSEKYGYRPLLPSIDAQEFELILSTTTDEQIRELLTKYGVAKTRLSFNEQWNYITVSDIHDLFPLS